MEPTTSQDQSNYYFDANDLRTLLGYEAVTYVVVTSSVSFELVPDTAVLTITAQGFNAEDKAVPDAIAYGCPNPCNGDHARTSCGDRARRVLSLYKKSYS